MLRFPNPGSDIGIFICIFQELFDALSTKSSFGLDDMTACLVKRNLVTSCGYMGQTALELSTRKDRSRDPLYNQSKMYSELYKVLGWLHPSERSRLSFKFTYLGAHVAEAKRKPEAIFRESILGIVYPNEILDVKGEHNLRPFAAILRTMKQLGGTLYRDEMIAGPLSLGDDRDEDQFTTMLKELESIRGDAAALDHKIKSMANKRNITHNTMTNYTRFPIAVLKWCQWAKPMRRKDIFL